MRLNKKALKIGLPLAGLAAIAITIPVALTSCSSTADAQQQQYYSFTQAQQLSFLSWVNQQSSNPTGDQIKAELTGDQIKAELTKVTGIPSSAFGNVSVSQSKMANCVDIKVELAANTNVASFLTPEYQAQTASTTQQASALSLFNVNYASGGAGGGGSTVTPTGLPGGDSAGPSGTATPDTNPEHHAGNPGHEGAAGPAGAKGDTKKEEKQQSEQTPGDKIKPVDSNNGKPKPPVEGNGENPAGAGQQGGQPQGPSIPTVSALVQKAQTQADAYVQSAFLKSQINTWIDATNVIEFNNVALSGATSTGALTSDQQSAFESYLAAIQDSTNLYTFLDTVKIALANAGVLVSKITTLSTTNTSPEYKAPDWSKAISVNGKISISNSDLSGISANGEQITITNTDGNHIVTKVSSDLMKSNESRIKTNLEVLNKVFANQVAAITAAQTALKTAQTAITTMPDGQEKTALQKEIKSATDALAPLEANLPTDQAEVASTTSAIADIPSQPAK